MGEKGTEGKRGSYRTTQPRTFRGPGALASHLIQPQQPCPATLFPRKIAPKPQCQGTWAPAALDASLSDLTLCAEGPGWQGLSLGLPQFPHLQKEDRFSGC